MLLPSKIINLGDNCIQNFHLRRYIVRYTVGNLVLRRRASGVVKCDFRTYIRRYTSPNENFECGHPHSNAFLLFTLKFERCKLHRVARHQTECDVINDDKLFLTVYHRIYCRKFLTLFNQTSCYKIKCIRIFSNSLFASCNFYCILVTFANCLDPAYIERLVLSIYCLPTNNIRHVRHTAKILEPRPYITERLLMGHKESNQTKTKILETLAFSYFEL